MHEQRYESLAVQHFRRLCAPRTEREVLDLLKKWLVEQGLPDTVSRNLKRFIVGRGREVSDALRPHMLAFCRQALKLEVDDNEFDVKDRRRDIGGEFADANAASRSLLEEICGKYTLFRPRTTKGEIERVKEAGKEYHPWEAEISRGSGHSFDFRLVLEDRTWTGRAYCSLGFLYMFAPELQNQNIVSAILAPLDGRVHDGVLVGCILMRVNHEETERHVVHGLVAARPVALARHGARRKAREEVASRWLDAEVASGAGFCIKLQEIPALATYESL
jgi:hypothetical protein